MICCCISMCYLTVCRKLEPGSSSGRMGNQDPSSAVLASEEEDAIALEIARIEANVRAFSLKEQQLRKSNLTKAWVEHKMVVGEESIVETKPMKSGWQGMPARICGWKILISDGARCRKWSRMQHGKSGKRSRIGSTG